MMEFNSLVEDYYPILQGMCEVFISGSLLHTSKSEHASVPKKIYEDSLQAYGDIVAATTTAK